MNRFSFLFQKCSSASSSQTFMDHFSETFKRSLCDIYGNAALRTIKMSGIYLSVSESVMIGQSGYFSHWQINSAENKGNK